MARRSTGSASGTTEDTVHQRAPAVVAAELRDLVVTLPEPDAGVANLLAAVDVSYLEAGMFSPEWVIAVRAVVGR